MLMNGMRRSHHLFRGPQRIQVQFFSNQKQRIDAKNSKVAYYMSGIVITVIGLSYASVPLYKAFCQMTGFGGTTQRYDELKSTTVKPVEGGRILRVNFQANVHSAMPWSFKPTQRDVRIVPGETALAFYTVHNPTDKAITGVATYNVHPPKAGLYFNKVQCFCFEEQRIGPGEEIDMPVFFFIDPEFLADPAMENVNLITLSYTFFKTGEDEEDLAVPMPKPVSVAAVSVAAVSVKSSSS